MSHETVLPYLVSQLTSSKPAIALILAGYSLFYLLPQFISANFAESLPRKKRFVMLVGGVGERLPYLLIGLVVWGLAVYAPGLALVVASVLLALSGMSIGILTPAWYDMIAKVIPVNKRGLWSGVSEGIGAILGLGGAILVGQILDKWDYPGNFGLCYTLAFVALALSWVGLALNREPLGTTAKSQVDWKHYRGGLFTVLQGNSNYTHYLIARSVVHIGGMASGFFIVYGIFRFQLSGLEVGNLTAVLIGSQAIFNVVWGLIADRKGHKIVLCGMAFAMSLAATVVWLAPTPGWLWLAFGFLGVVIAGDTVSSLNIILEFCNEMDRPTYIGLTNTILGPLAVLAPLVGGWLASVGYEALFITAITTSVLGGGLLMVWVREPRLHPQQTRLSHS